MYYNHIEKLHMIPVLILTNSRQKLYPCNFNVQQYSKCSPFHDLSFLWIWQGNWGSNWNPYGIWEPTFEQVPNSDKSFSPIDLFTSIIRSYTILRSETIGCQYLWPLANYDQVANQIHHWAWHMRQFKRWGHVWFGVIWSTWEFFLDKKLIMTRILNMVHLLWMCRT